MVLLGGKVSIVQAVKFSALDVPMHFFAIYVSRSTFYTLKFAI